MEFHLYNMESRMWFSAEKGGFTYDVTDAGLYPEQRAIYTAILANKANGTKTTPLVVIVPAEGYAQSQ